MIITNIYCDHGCQFYNNGSPTEECSINLKYSSHIFSFIFFYFSFITQLNVTVSNAFGYYLERRWYIFLYFSMLILMIKKMLYHMIDVIKGTWWWFRSGGGRKESKQMGVVEKKMNFTTQLRPHILVSSFVWNQVVLCIDNLDKQKNYESMQSLQRRR